MKTRPLDPPDLSDKAWAWINHVGLEARPGGRPEAYPTREILNAICSLRRSGGSWRMLPHALPPWRMVYHDVRQWRLDGTWQARHDLLRGAVRVAAGQHRQPSAGVLDRHAVKTPETGGSGALLPANG